MSIPIQESLNNILFSAKSCYETGFCRDANCENAVAMLPETKRWFITFGHAGFNSRLNNMHGYDTKAKAMAAMKRYLKK